MIHSPKIQIVIPDYITDPKERRLYYWREYGKRGRELFGDHKRKRDRKTYLRLQKQRKAYRQSDRAKKVRQKWVEQNRERIRVWFRNYYRIGNNKQSYINARYVRLARLKGCKTDRTAEVFYNFVRSKNQIPCYYCKKVISGRDAHIDHVIAVNLQGNHASDNLCASCVECNLRKSDKLPSAISFLDQPLLNL